MSLKLIFDVGIIGELHHNQAGLYRMTDELLNALLMRDDLQISYSLYAHKNCKIETKQIEPVIKEKNWAIKGVNTRRRIRYLPFRKEKLFKYLYRKVNIHDYHIVNRPEISEANLFHTTYYPVPQSLRKYKSLKKIVTVHDLIPLIYPNYNSGKILIEEVLASVREDGYIICVSENTKRDVLKYAPEIPEKRIFVSLLAANPKKFYACKDDNKRTEVIQKYNLPNRYFLALSTLEPRKNIPHLIRSFITMITQNNIDDLGLVLVGSKGWDYNSIFEEYENAAEKKEKIIFTGRIPDEDLASVYSQADAFFYMSFYEGFGLPPLEAMQCAVPTVVSNTSSLPEVVGDAGFLIDPNNSHVLIETMHQLYTDKELRKEYAQKALERSKNFSWEKTAEQHIEIYKQILTT